MDSTIAMTTTLGRFRAPSRIVTHVITIATTLDGLGFDVAVAAIAMAATATSNPRPSKVVAIVIT